MNNMLNFATHGRLQLAPIGTLLKNGLTCYDEVRVCLVRQFDYMACASHCVHSERLSVVSQRCWP